jgi:hypothetical protein
MKRGHASRRNPLICLVAEGGMDRRVLPGGGARDAPLAHAAPEPSQRFALLFGGSTPQAFDGLEAETPGVSSRCLFRHVAGEGFVAGLWPAPALRVPGCAAAGAREPSPAASPPAGFKSHDRNAGHEPGAKVSWLRGRDLNPRPLGYENSPKVASSRQEATKRDSIGRSSRQLSLHVAARSLHFRPTWRQKESGIHFPPATRF